MQTLRDDEGSGGLSGCSAGLQLCRLTTHVTVPTCSIAAAAPSSLTAHACDINTLISCPAWLLVYLFFNAETGPHMTCLLGTFTAPLQIELLPHDYQD